MYIYIYLYTYIYMEVCAQCSTRSSVRLPFCTPCLPAAKVSSGVSGVNRALPTPAGARAPANAARHRRHRRGYAGLGGAHPAPPGHRWPAVGWWEGLWVRRRGARVSGPGLPGPLSLRRGGRGDHREGAQERARGEERREQEVQLAARELVLRPVHRGGSQRSLRLVLAAGERPAGDEG